MVHSQRQLIRVGTHSRSYKLGEVVVSILYHDSDGGGAGELHFCPFVLSFYYDCVFFCDLIGQQINQTNK